MKRRGFFTACAAGLAGLLFRPVAVIASHLMPWSKMPPEVAVKGQRLGTFVDRQVRLREDGRGAGACHSAYLTLAFDPKTGKPCLAARHSNGTRWYLAPLLMDASSETEWAEFAKTIKESR